MGTKIREKLRRMNPFTRPATLDELPRPLPANPDQRLVRVYVEGYEDVAFWRGIFDHFHNPYLRFEISVPDRGDLPKGKKVLMGMIPDSSEEMLGKAYENSAQSGKILYLCQDITEFELYGTVSAAVCTTDTLNHLTDDESVAKVFSLLHNYLDPGGIFIFDVNSEYKFSSVYGQNDYVLEDEGCLLTWQNDYDPENATADFYLTLFEETDGGLWRRTDTEFSEKYHSPEKLTAMLAHCGFEVLSVTDSYTDGSISEKTQRLCFTAKRDLL